MSYFRIRNSLVWRVVADYH